MMFGITAQDIARYQKMSAAGFSTETMQAAGVTVNDLDRLAVDELIAKRHAYEMVETEREFNRRYPDVN